MNLQHFILHHARNTIPLYANTKVLSVANVNGNIVLCVEAPDVAPDYPVFERTFIVKVNGEYVTDEPKRTFLGTVITKYCDCGTDTDNMPDQINHVYEVLTT